MKRKKRARLVLKPTLRISHKNLLVVYSLHLSANEYRPTTATTHSNYKVSFTDDLMFTVRQSK